MNAAALGTALEFAWTQSADSAWSKRVLRENLTFYLALQSPDHAISWVDRLLDEGELESIQAHMWLDALSRRPPSAAGLALMRLLLEA